MKVCVIFGQSQHILKKTPPQQSAMIWPKLGVYVRGPFETIVTSEK